MPNAGSSASPGAESVGEIPLAQKGKQRFFIPPFIHLSAAQVPSPGPRPVPGIGKKRQRRQNLYIHSLVRETGVYRTKIHREANTQQFPRSKIQSDMDHLRSQLLSLEALGSEEEIFFCIA